uniref:Uncharacterized protein n=1 Tax=Chelydra serpentina TaxID=8475 RepID=A0A8C3TA46_CHESE
AEATSIYLRVLLHIIRLTLQSLGQKWEQHLFLIGLCLWKFLMLVCHITVSFSLVPFGKFTRLAGMHIWSLSIPKLQLSAG